MIYTQDLALYYHDIPAFREISMAVEKGRIMALIGPSGCGKTSFLTCLNRLTDMIPGCRIEGRVVVGGMDVYGPGTEVVALRRRVGMIFQKPNPFPLTIRKNIELPLRDQGIRKPKDLDDDVVEAVLRDVGLWEEVKDRLHSPALSLSGGQQQRLCIARALALRPEVLLLDEPCGALDPLSSGVVEDLILSLRQRYTLVIVTHNLSQARRIADHVALFWVRDGAGRLIEYGPAEQIFKDPKEALTAAYINGIRG
jgi:phosphate transport system ATP-binding protein